MEKSTLLSLPYAENNDEWHHEVEFRKLDFGVLGEYVVRVSMWDNVKMPSDEGKDGMRNGASTNTVLTKDQVKKLIEFLQGVLES